MLSVSNIGGIDMSIKREKNIKGVITLEACICVLSFLILMLLLSSLFVMFLAQNVTAHTILQVSESMSIDSYSAKHIGTGGAGSVSSVMVSVSDFIGGLFGVPSDNPSFTSRKDLDSLSEEERDAEVDSLVKSRFIGYLSGGDETKADEFLEQINIVNGLDGIDFTGSYIDDGMLYVVLKYKLEYDFNIWGVGDIDVEQKACAKLWK